MAHRRALEGSPWQPVRGEAEGADMGGNVGDPERPFEVAEVLEEARALGPFRHGPVLLGGEARGDEVLRRARLVDGGDGGVACAGQRPGALGHLVEHGLEVEAGADPQARRAERGDARAQRLVLASQVAVGHPFLPAPAAGRAAGPGAIRRRTAAGAGCPDSIRLPAGRVEIAKNSCKILVNTPLTDTIVTQNGLLSQGKLYAVRHASRADSVKGFEDLDGRCCVRGATSGRAVRGNGRPTWIVRWCKLSLQVLPVVRRGNWTPIGALTH